VSVAEQIPDKLEIGDVFDTAIGVISRNLVLCLLLGGLSVGLPTAINAVLSLIWDGSQQLSPDEMPTVMQLAWGVASTLILLALWAVLQAALVRLVIADFSGRQPSFGDCLATGFAVALPLIGMSILIWLGVA